MLVGAAVIWINGDSGECAVVSGDSLFDKFLARGMSFSYAFAGCGTID